MVVERKRVSIDCGVTETNKGRTVQSEIDGCDINKMMATFQATGQLPQGSKIPQYGDFTNATDYMEAKNLTNEADHMFDLLPARIRTEFNNNPAELLAFMNDEDNKDKAVELGFLEAPDPVPDPAPTATDPPADSPPVEPSA